VALLGLLILGAATTLLAADRATALPEYAQAFYRGDYETARTLASARLREEPSDTRARLVLARVAAAKGRFDEAFDAFYQALRRDPHNPDALYYLGVTAGALAQVEYRRLLALAPDSARAHQLQGQSLEASDRPAEAEAEYKAALEKNPRLVEVLIALGDLARSDLAQTAERLEEARQYYQRAVEQAPGNYYALYGLGVCYAYAGNHARAIEVFRRALQQDPDSARAHLALGISLFESGQPEAAVTELETATRIQPKLRNAYFQLARAYFKLGRQRETEEATTRFRELAREEEESAAAARQP
jgi:tetratricopeptide (TPR) repeat protein